MPLARSNLTAYGLTALASLALGLVLGAGLHLLGAHDEAHDGANGAPLLMRQLGWLVVGAGLGLGATFIPSRWLVRAAYPLGALVLGALLCTPWLHALSWRRVAPIVALVLIGVLARAAPSMARLRAPLAVAAYVSALLASALLFRLEGGVSGAVIALVGTLAIVSLDRRGRWVALGSAALLLITSPAIWRYGLHAYQRARIIAWLDPGADALGSGYAILMSRSLLRDGGLWGQGAGAWNERARELPTAITDLPLSVISYEHGWFAAGALFAALCLPIVFAVAIFRRTDGACARALVAGIGGWWAATLVCSAGAGVGLVPLSAAVLPLVSPGGSAAVSALVSLGLLAHVSLRNRRASEGGSQSSIARHSLEVEPVEGSLRSILHVA